MNRFILVCIFLCVLFSAKAQLPVGDSLFAIGEYRAAALYYEKAIFLGNLDANGQYTALINKSKSLKLTGEFQLAFNTLMRMNPYLYKTDQKVFEIFYERVVNAYMVEDWDTALRQLQEAKYAVQNDSLLQFLIVPEIMSLNNLHQWEKARQLASSFVLERGWVLDVDSLYAVTKKRKLKKVKTARWLSTFLLGVGQAYAGKPLKGFASFVLQISALAYGTYHILNGYYFVGYLTGAGLFQAFYFGGIKHAAYLVEQRNRNIQVLRANMINQEILIYTKKAD